MARRGGKIRPTDKAFIITKGKANAAIKGITDNIQAALDGLVFASEEELDDIVDEVLEDSNRRAPMDTGELRESQFKRIFREADKTTFVFGYTADHSAFQHELYNDSYANPTTPGTEPKFLQKALNAVETDIAKRMADAIKLKV